MQITPINAGQQQQVAAATRDCIRRVGELLDCALQPVPVSFALTGRVAGMYRVQRGQREIRYNPYIFGKYFTDNLATTVPHEVAHYATDVLYGLHNVRPHGAEWRTVMQLLGADPTVTCRYDLSGIPLRRQRRFRYRCACSTHAISTARHNRVSSGRARYYCKHCRTALAFAG
jgi:SprT protein